MLTTIRVYGDDGASQKCVSNSIKTLNQLLPNSQISIILSEEVVMGTWISQTDLLIMPGGEDLPYISKLGQEGISNIKKFVENGGKYIGICAGAYFSSSFIRFDVKGKQPIEGERFLKFFEGNANGPLYDGYEPNSENGAHLIPIKYNENQVYVYYNGGCYFDDSNNTIKGNHFAFYENGRSGGYFRQIEKGKIILTGFHFEFGIEDCLDLIGKSPVMNFELNRLKLAKYIVGLLGLPITNS